MCSSDAPAPDPMIGQAAMANSAIAKEALDYYRAKDAADKPYRDQASQMALEQARVQAETSKTQNARADELYKYNVDTFRPLEQRQAADAIGYDTPARREADAAQAIADVGTQAEAAKANVMQDLASRGVDPSSGSTAIALARMGIGTGAMKAAAGNQARKAVEQVGSAKVADAAALGRNMVSNNATQTQLGLQAGNSSVGNAQVPLNISQQQAAQMAQGYGVGIQGNQSAGSILNNQYGTGTQAASSSSASSASSLATIGSMAGMAMMAFSDEEMKEGVAPVSDEEALEAVDGTPVKRWKYKPGTPADDGGQEHVGPMAQDVQRTMGPEVAPGGKMIDLVSANGVTMKAVQAIDKKVNKLAATLGVAV